MLVGVQSDAVADSRGCQAGRKVGPLHVYIHNYTDLYIHICEMICICIADGDDVIVDV